MIGNISPASTGSWASTPTLHEVFASIRGDPRMMKLYYSPGACSMAPHILLEEIGVPYEAVRVAIAEGKTRSPEYLAINPKGRVPALFTAEGEILTEVPAISCYLAEHSPGVRLLPQGGLPLARCLEWFNW